MWQQVSSSNIFDTYQCCWHQHPIRYQFHPNQEVSWCHDLNDTFAWCTPSSLPLPQPVLFRLQATLAQVLATHTLDHSARGIMHWSHLDHITVPDQHLMTGLTPFPWHHPHPLNISYRLIPTTSIASSDNTQQCHQHLHWITQPEVLYAWSLITSQSHLDHDVAVPDQH